METDEKYPLGPIGVFDSGYGGLTILKELRRELPQYDYLYLGDNARAPYGSRSFDVVYKFTLEAVRYLFGRGCPLVILACNTASAKALRTIQQTDLPAMGRGLRVLGVIRPTAEAVGEISPNGKIGVMGTAGTVSSGSYDMEISKLNPGFSTYSQACPMWVPLVENDESSSDGADYFVKKYVDSLLEKSAEIDTLILACTHYPILLPKIREAVPEHINIVTQGEIVARSLADYLRRHPEMEVRLSKEGGAKYLTTEDPTKFTSLAAIFLNDPVNAEHISLT